MKTTFTTLTAVAALVAGISIAGAQTSTMPKSGSAMTTGSGKFCIGTAGSTLNCKYASLADCQKDATGSQKCSANPNGGTTGSK